MKHQEDHIPEYRDDERIVRLIQTIENDVRTLRQLLSAGHEPELGGASIPPGFFGGGPQDDGIEGIFDGERMIDANGKSYQVPPNYASKSKLIEGDPLKLYIGADGKYVYKQLGPVERRTIPGLLRMEGNHYVVDADEGVTYSILTACVTYYMALYNIKVGDRVMIMVPAEGHARWAVIDNIA
jgi:hypothetical protein